MENQNIIHMEDYFALRQGECGKKEDQESACHKAARLLIAVAESAATTAIGVCVVVCALLFFTML